MPLVRVAHYHDHGYCLTDKWVRCRESKCTDPHPIFDRWLCTKRTKVVNQPRYNTCGQEYFFGRTDRTKAAGPANRRLDRRYAVGVLYKCKHTAGTGVLRHESAPDPEQPLQDPFLFEQIEKLQVVAKEARKKRGRKKASTA